MVIKSGPLLVGISQAEAISFMTRETRDCWSSILGLGLYPLRLMQSLKHLCGSISGLKVDLNKTKFM